MDTLGIVALCFLGFAFLLAILAIIIWPLDE